MAGRTVMQDQLFAGIWVQLQELLDGCFWSIGVIRKRNCPKGTGVALEPQAASRIRILPDIARVTAPLTPLARHAARNILALPEAAHWQVAVEGHRDRQEPVEEGQHEGADAPVIGAPGRGARADEERGSDGRVLDEPHQLTAGAVADPMQRQAGKAGLQEVDGAAEVQFPPVVEGGGIVLDRAALRRPDAAIVDRQRSETGAAQVPRVAAVEAGGNRHRSCHDDASSRMRWFEELAADRPAVPGGELDQGRAASGTGGLSSTRMTLVGAGGAADLEVAESPSPCTHLSPKKPVSHFSPAPQRPWQGRTSQRPER